MGKERVVIIPVCDICQDRKPTMPIRLAPGDICDKCWIIYISNQTIPEWVHPKQAYRYVKALVRKKRGYKIQEEEEVLCDV